MTTLATLRGKLNNEVGIVNDADTIPWSVATRNQAISDGYAALWRAGVWKPVLQDISATVTDQWLYPLTSIRRLERLEALDSSSRVIDRPRGVIEPNDTANETYQLRLSSPLASGFALRVRGYTAYISTFANDGASDDLPAEHNRIPLIKARAILYRIQLGLFARYGERQAVAPPMNVTADQLGAIVAATEREFLDAAATLSRLRTRTGQARGI